MAVSFVLLALGLLIWPRRREDITSTGKPRSRRQLDSTGEPTASRRERLLVPAAGLSASVVTITLGGVPSGLLAAVVIGPVVALGTEWLRRRPSTPAPDRSLALVLDLAAAVLRSGRPLPTALEIAAPAAAPAAAAAMTRVARLLALGAEPREAWRSCAPPRSALEPVAAVAVRSQASGIKLADAFERLATDLRAECGANAAARANRAGIHAMGPLAACFLPSFVCLGIVPVIVGIAAAATRTLQ